MNHSSTSSQHNPLFQEYESKTLFDILQTEDFNHKSVVAAEVNGIQEDLCATPPSNASIRWIFNHEPEGLKILRHSCAHVLAQAIMQLYPSAKYTIGPVKDERFYYDFHIKESLKETDLSRIQKVMNDIVKADYKVTREIWPLHKIRSFFQAQNNKYKLEILDQLESNGISEARMYSQGNFIDLCRGPHAPSTQYVKFFQLLELAGTHWRGKESNPFLLRIYGTCFQNANDLENFSQRMIEIKQFDHRNIAKQQNLCAFFPESPGAVFFTPKGQTILNVIKAFLRLQNQKRGYQEVSSPTMLKSSLWKQSGHYDCFAENMFFSQVESQEYIIKPMNCPGHCLLFKNELRSIHELPLKFSEFGIVHRNERSGVLRGLFRLRKFVQDDAHIFCSSEQLQSEIIKVIQEIVEIYKYFGFSNHSCQIATRPEKYIGSEKDWENAIFILKKGLIENNLPFSIKEGEGAFYGPKIEFSILDNLKRNWQCGTVQIDFSMPKKMNLKYVHTNNYHSVPVLIHRAILGSLERFLGIFMEHSKGKWPFWLAPQQICIIPIQSACQAYANNVEEIIYKHCPDIRIGKNFKNETLSYKIRHAQNNQVPMILILGKQEDNNGSISMRFDKKNYQNITMQDFFSILDSTIMKKDT